MIKKFLLRIWYTIAYRPEFVYRSNGDWAVKASGVALIQSYGQRYANSFHCYQELVELLEVESHPFKIYSGVKGFYFGATNPECRSFITVYDNSKTARKDLLKLKNIIKYVPLKPKKVNGLKELLYD